MAFRWATDARQAYPMDHYIRYYWDALPKLIRFLLTHFANGVAIGWVTALIVIRIDLGNLGTLLASAKSGWVAPLFFIQVALIFGTVGASAAIMTMDYE